MAGSKYFENIFKDNANQRVSIYYLNSKEENRAVFFIRLLKKLSKPNSKCSERY